MTEAVRHVVWDEMERRKQAPIKPPPNEMPNIPRDPLTSFENFHPQVRTDLASWMTLDKQARLDRAVWFCNTFVDTAMKMTPDRRQKSLCYIIYMESLHPLGDRDVAAIAFKGLFGENLKKKIEEPAVEEKKVQ